MEGRRPSASQNQRRKNGAPRAWNRWAAASMAASYRPFTISSVSAPPHDTMGIRPFWMSHVSRQPGITGFPPPSGIAASKLA